jgi:hypothetical protein
MNSRLILSNVNRELRNWFHNNVRHSTIVVQKEDGGNFTTDQQQKQKRVITVGQGQSKVSIDGSLLQSNNFTACTPIVFFDALNKYSMLMHLDAGLGSLVQNQFSQLQDLPDGSYSAIVIKGNRTRQTLQSIGGNITQAQKDNLIRLQEVELPTGDSPYSILVDPLENTILLQTKPPNPMNYKISDIGLTFIKEMEGIQDLADAFKLSHQERIQYLFH